MQMIPTTRKGTALSRLTFQIALLALLFFGVRSSRADGVAYEFANGCNFAAVEGGSVSITISLVRVRADFDSTWENHFSNPLSQCISIVGNGTTPLSSADVANSQYGVCNNTTVTWGANDYSSKTITIHFNDNSVAQLDRTATVSVSGTVVSGACQSAPLTLYDDDEQVGVEALGPQVWENGINGANTVKVRFYRNTTGDARTVNFTLSGNASGMDYSSSPALGNHFVTIASGSDHTDVTVTASGDSLLEGDETRTIQLDSGTGYQIDPDASSTSFIIVDNYPTNGVFATNIVTVQGETKSAFVFFRNPAYSVSPSKTVNFTVSGTASNGVDYTPELGDSIVIPAGAVAVTNVITPTAYTNLTGTKTIIVTLDSGNKYVIDPDYSSATVGILQDAPSVVIKPSIPNAYSGVPGQFTIIRTGRTNTVLSVPLTIGGTAIAGTDYTALPETIVFNTNQISTNLPVNVLADVSSAKTITISIQTNAFYYLGSLAGAIVTLLPASDLTSTVPQPAGRYWRGSGSNPTYWSLVVPLDYEVGTVYSNMNGNCSTLYPEITSWSDQTYYHYDATNTLSQADISNRIEFNNPIAAFGERVGGTPLYLNQNYSFGIYAGDPAFTEQPIVVQAYYRTNLQLAGSTILYAPVFTNRTSWGDYSTNFFRVTTNAFGLTSILSDTPSMTWGANSFGGYVLTHVATDLATNYYYVIQHFGYPTGQTNAMALNGSGEIAPSLLYTLEFEPRPPWRSVFIDQPHFDGSPLPPFYAGETVDEILTNTPPVTNAVTLSPSACTNLDDSPELRRHPILDQFVSDMGNDPIALANYVLNEIGLTDPMDYNDDGSTSEESINEGGVSRGALGTFLEKQGSPAEECALLVYLLRQAGVPAVYEFAPHNGMKIVDARLSRMLQFQVKGGYKESGRLYTTNGMIAVNYPWVAAYIGTNWVHIFPWLKDYQITEGLDLYDYMPTNYSSAYPWVRDYIYGDTNLLSLAVDGNNTPAVIFPRFLAQTLEQNYPGISVDDLGVKIQDRRHYYARWQDFPRPTWLTNTSIALTSLSDSGITNVNPALTNVFDTLSVEIYSVNDPTKDIQTGDLRLVDLHDRLFYITQSNSAPGQVTLSLILAPFRTNVTTQASFTDDPDLLSRQVLSMNLGQFDDDLIVRFKYHRHRALAPADPVDPFNTFLGVGAERQIVIERPLRKGDLAALCLDYGRVTRDMVNLHTADLWQMQSALRADSSLTNSLSTDVYQGTLMYVCGMQYYKSLSDFDVINRNLHKINVFSLWAAGLSKISPSRDASGNLTGGTVDPVLPNVDMFYIETAAAGNGTLRPDSGRTFQIADQNYQVMAIVNGSAQEHQVINDFYQQTNAVSTVRLLQLAQQRGQGIVPLSIVNYVSQGQTLYQGDLLQNHDPIMWQQVSSFFQNPAEGGYTLGYMTPGPVTNSAYAGMGALMLGWSHWAAIISPDSLNGGFGENFPDGSFSADNTVNWNVNSSGDNASVNFLSPDEQEPILTPDVVPTYNVPYVTDQVLNGNYSLDRYDGLFAQDTSDLLGLDGSQALNQTYTQGLETSTERGFLGWLSDAGSQALSRIADPVHTVTGEFFVDDTDLQLPGPIPLTLRRNYSSQNLADNQFGPGWKLSLMPYLSVSEGATNIYAADMDGVVLAYVRTSTNTSVWLPTLAANPQLNNNTTAGVGGLANRLRDRLVMSVDGSTTNYTLYGADGSTRSFQTMTFDNGILNQTRPYLLKWTDNRGNYYTFSYGTDSTQTDFGQVRRIQCSNGNYLGFYYDIYGHILEAYSGDGRRVEYNYDQFGDLRTVTLPDESTRSYVYQHQTQSVTNGTVVTQQPYSTHLITEEDKPDGRALLNIYDDQRRVTNQLSTAGVDLTPVRTATFIFANNFNVTNSYTNGITGYTLIIDGLGNTNRYDYTNSLITKITDPLNQTIEQVWYADNAAAPGYPRSLEQRTDKRGLVTTYKYDANGNVTNTVVTGDLTGDGIASQTATNTATYNANNLPLQLTDPVGNKKVYVYDSQFVFLPQQIIRYAGASAVSTNFQIYGSVTNVVTLGALTQTNRAFGVMTRQVRAYGSSDAATNDLAYDGHGFLIQSVKYTRTSDPAVTNTFFYNERGELVDSMDALGAVTHADYDSMNRPTARERFDENGDLLSWSFNYYNDNGELVWSDGPRFNPEDYVFRDYDGAGRLTTEIHWRSEAKADGTGVQAPADYDLFAQTFNFYDVLGNLTYSVDPRGAITTNSWDALGRLTLTRHLDTDETTVLSTESYSYEPGGQVHYHTNALGGYTQTEYTDAGQPEFRRNADGSTNAWRYYLDGRVKREIQSNGAYWQTTYDDANRITTRVFYSAAGTALATNSTQMDRRGNLIARVDEAGNVFTNLYDGLDRLKVSAGPAIPVVTQQSSMDPSAPPVYITNILQHITTSFYDAAGRALTNVNALGEKTITYRDALGRTTRTEIRGSTGALVRETGTAYSADHNSVTVTNGSGANAIVNTTFTDNDGRTVLAVGYPSSGVLDFTRQKYDLSGNLAYQEHDTSTGGSVTTWTSGSYTYDGLNRMLAQTDRDNATTYYAYDSAGDVTNRIMPGGLEWNATYNSAGQERQDWITGTDGSCTQTNAYDYFSSGSPFAGLLQTKTDGRGVAITYSYDDWLRVTNLSIPTGNLTSWGYDARGFATNITQVVRETFGLPSPVVVSRAYDAYGQLSYESITEGVAGISSAFQGWDAAGRRIALSLNGFNYGFGWRADGVLTSVSTANGNATYGYDSAGLLTTRTVGSRQTSVTSRDGEGRSLAIGTTVNTLTKLSESLSYTGDGLIAAHTLARADFTDSRSYSYADLSRRLTDERLNLDGSTRWTNTFVYDNGASGGPGILTHAGSPAPSAAAWNGGINSLAQIGVETNTAIIQPANGQINAYVTVHVALDGKSLPVNVVPTGTYWQWLSDMELLPGAHHLTASATTANGLFTTNASVWFTNNAAGATAIVQRDPAGNITERAWLNPDGTTNRWQQLIWDPQNRLSRVLESDADGSGYLWMASYDGLNRRVHSQVMWIRPGSLPDLHPTDTLVEYDPEVEFLELGITWNGTQTWKLCGPDLNGKYGGMNGTGGLDATIPGESNFNPVISDARGNLLGEVTNGIVSWFSSRITGFGAVPSYRPMAMERGGDLAQASAWRGRRVEVNGHFDLGARWYDPAAGMFVSYDPAWNSRDPNYLTFAGGDPINYFDPDGRVLLQEWQQTQQNLINRGGFWNNAAAYGISFGTTALNAFSLGNLSRNDALADKNLAGQISDAQMYGGMTINTIAATAAVATGGAVAPIAGRALVATGSPALMYIGSGAAAGLSSSAVQVGVERTGDAIGGIPYNGTVGSDLTYIGGSTLGGAVFGAITYGAVRAGSGVIYQRVDVNGLKGEYYGQANSDARYSARQIEEGKQWPDSIFSFSRVNSAGNDESLDFMEQFYMTANGGSKTQNPLTPLSNEYRAMSDERFNDFLFNTTAGNGVGAAAAMSAYNPGALGTKR